MTRRRIIVDAETTALEPDYATGRGVIWELAAIELDGPIATAEHIWRMKPDLAKADPGALRVGKYYERTAAMCWECRPSGVYDLAGVTDDDRPHWSGPSAVAAEVARLLDDATIIGANPAFDALFLTGFLRSNGQAPTWHYRLRDIGSIAHGYLRACAALAMPGRDAAMGVPAFDASTDEFARALGVDPGKFERHSALGDCRLAAAMLAVVEGSAR
jgi:DNA polymerase III epsilon subunit-like protein